jgi:hypothetical protein
MSEWTVVRTLGTEEDASLVAGFLESAGIEARVESHLFHQEPVNFGKLGDVRVLVPEASLVEAERVLAERDAEPVPEGSAEE